MEQEDLSPIGLRPKTGDSSSSHRLSENVMRFGESLASVTKLQTVLDAKKAFLGMIRSRSKDEQRPVGESLDGLVAKEWDAIAANPLCLTIASIDFSGLETVIEKAEKEEKAAKEMPCGSPGASLHPPGAPPPPPGAPPPPPGAPPSPQGAPPPPPGAPPPPPGAPRPPGVPPPPVITFNNTMVSVGQLGAAPGDSVDSRQERMRQIHVAGARVAPGKDTVWSSQPPGCGDLEDLRRLFTSLGQEETRTSVGRAGAAGGLGLPSPALTATETRDILILTRGMPRKEKLIAAIKSMDDDILNREQVDKLISFFTKQKFKDMTGKVNKFSKEHPNTKLSDPEEFLVTLNKTEGVEESLNLWRFREDFEASEKDVCDPLNAMKTLIEELKQSQEIKLVFKVALQVVNFMKDQNFKGLALKDLDKFDKLKDNSKQHSLLFHMVRKVVEVEPSFPGFPPGLLDLLGTVSRVDMALLGEGLPHMERECRKSLGFLILEDRLSSTPGGGTSHLFLVFIKEVVERIVTMQRIKTAVSLLYTDFLNWLCVPPTAPLNTFCQPDTLKTLKTFCESVNRLRSDLTKVSKTASSPKIRVSQEEPKKGGAGCLKSLLGEHPLLKVEQCGDPVAREEAAWLPEDTKPEQELELKLDSLLENFTRESRRSRMSSKGRGRSGRGGNVAGRRDRFLQSSLEN